MASIVKVKGDRNKPWRLNYEIFGVRKRVFFKTKGEAEIYKREVEKAEIFRSLGVENVVQKRVPLEQAITDYLASSKVKKTQRCYQQECQWLDWMLERLKQQGLVYVTDVQHIHMERLQTLLRQSVKASTVNRRFNTIKHFFKKCELWGFLDKNPTAWLKKLPEDGVTKRIWTKAELESFFHHAEPWVRKIFFFLSQTGARPSSVERLTWKDVDFDQNVIVFSTRKGTGQLSHYSFPLAGDLRSLLQEERALAESQGSLSGDSRVFVNSSGQPVTAAHIVRKGAQVIARAKLKGLTLYGLRHTLITRAANIGGVHRASLLAGHRNLKTTQAYIHLSQDELQQTLKLVHSDSWAKSS